MEVIFTLKDIGSAAQKLLRLTAGSTVFAIHGEMGAGKTTFIHAVCKALGVTGNISSPTFSIINQYKTTEGKPVYHMDLYRLKDDTEAINAGVEDYLYSKNICLVEWPQKAPHIFPENTLHLYINAVNNDTRKISFDLNNSPE